MLDFTKWENVKRVKEIERALELYRDNEWTIKMLFGEPQIEKMLELEKMLGPKLNPSGGRLHRLFYHLGVPTDEKHIMGVSHINRQLVDTHVDPDDDSCMMTLEHFNGSEIPVSPSCIGDCNGGLDDIVKKLHMQEIVEGDTVIWDGHRLKKLSMDCLFFHSEVTEQQLERLEELGFEVRSIGTSWGHRDMKDSFCEDTYIILNVKKVNQP